MKQLLKCNKHVKGQMYFRLVVLLVASVTFPLHGTSSTLLAFGIGYFSGGRFPLQNSSYYWYYCNFHKYYHYYKYFKYYNHYSE